MTEKPNLSNELLNVVYMNPEDLRPSPRNCKRHPESQIKAVADSISKLGFNNPIIVKSDFEIIGGHCRWLASKLLGMPQVPVIILFHLSDEEARLMTLADNRLSELGKYDENLLKIELTELENICVDVGIEITGFSSVSVDVLTSEEKTDDKKLDALPLIPEEERVVQKGDLWIIDGRHRVYCGDSTLPESFEILFGDKKATLCLQDMPWNVKIQGHVCGNGKASRNHKEFAFASGEMTDQEFQDFARKNFELCKKYTTDGSLHLNFIDWRGIYNIQTAANLVFDSLVNILIWDKKIGGMGTLWRSQHEMICVHKNGKGKHINNIQLGANGRYRTNILSEFGTNAFGKHKGALRMHPTSKPEKLLRSLIYDVSNRGSIVLDSFSGSGSCLIACEKAKRIFYGIEYEGLYCDVIIRRYLQCFGGTVINEATGQSYDELLQAKIESNKNN